MLVTFGRFIISQLPLTKSSLQYGSNNGGITVLTKDSKLLNLVSTVGKKINLAGRQVNGTTIHGPIDLEGHLGSVRIRPLFISNDLKGRFVLLARFCSYLSTNISFELFPRKSASLQFISPAIPTAIPQTTVLWLFLWIHEEWSEKWGAYEKYPESH